MTVTQNAIQVNVNVTYAGQSITIKPVLLLNAETGGGDNTNNSIDGGRADSIYTNTLDIDGGTSLNL